MRPQLHNGFWRSGSHHVATCIAAVWPDRYCDTDDQRAQGMQSTTTAYLHRPNFHIVPAGPEQGPSSDAERERLLKWNLTALTYMHVDDWRRVFEEVGYTGDYYWFIAE